jgi:DNA-binding transcriptional LysR family regulator
MVGMGVAIIPYQAVAREVRTGQLFCARIAGQQLVRETGWVHLRLNRVPRAVQELMRTLEKVRPKLKLSPGPPSRGRTAASAEKSDQPASE